MKTIDSRSSQVRRDAPYGTGDRVRSRHYLIAALLLAVELSFAAQTASAAAPKLSYIYPAGGQRGTKVAATLTGEFDWPIGIHAPGVEVTALEEKGKVEITIPDDLTADRVWLRLHNAEGASDLAPFLIGSLPETVEVEPNNGAENVQKLEQTEILVNGVLQSGGDIDCYSLELTAGQTIVASVDANSRLGSPVDAVLQIAAPEGNVLADNHDDVDLDPRLAYTVPATGTYLVRIFGFAAAPNTTIAYHGSANYIYRLTITTGPFITHTLPTSVPLAEPGDVEVFGWNIPPGMRLPVVSFGGARLADNQEFDTLDDLRGVADDRIGLIVAPQLAGPARVRLSPYPSIRELVTGNVENSQPLVPPIALVGLIEEEKQHDIHRLSLKGGQPVVIAVESRNIDSLLDPPLLKLLDPAGSVVANLNAPSPARAALLTYAPAQDGEYQLVVRPRYRQGGERCFYRLTVRPEHSDFELTASADTLVVPHDKPAELTVTVVRRAGPEGAVGPITIEAVDLPEGVTAAAVVSETSGDTAGSVKLSFTSTGVAFSGPIRIVGTATAPGEIKRYARTPAKLSTCFETFWLTSIAKP